jgi:hypothetical protein
MAADSEKKPDRQDPRDVAAGRASSRATRPPPVVALREIARQWGADQPSATAPAPAPASWQRIEAGTARAARARWIGYALLGAAAAALTGPFLVLVLIACGLVEVAVQARPTGGAAGAFVSLALPVAVSGRRSHCAGVGGIQGRRSLLRRRVPGLPLT